MNKPINQPENDFFFKLPLEPDTVKLTLKTLDIHSEFRRPKRPYLSINIRKIYFRNEVLTIGVRLDDESEERVFIRVKRTELLISCTVDTDESYLSRYAYFALCELMSIYDYYNFNEFYWPDFFDPKTGTSKYLDIINDRRGMDISLKPKYSFFYKPGLKLIYPVKDSKIVPRTNLIRQKENLNVENNNPIGFCFADTFLKSWHSNHYPFLIPYYGCWTKNKNAIKGYLGFIRDQKSTPVLNYTPSQEKLNKLCSKMIELASIKSPVYGSSEKEKWEIQKDNLKRRDKLFALWEQALPLLQDQQFTHHYFTYGMKNVIGKPRKKDMQPCTFSIGIPKPYFLWVDKGEFYELEFRFKVGNKIFVPYKFNTAFFISAKNTPTEFYLLATLTDYYITSFFAQYNFKISVLKKHYQQYFKRFTDQLAKAYEFK